MSVNPLQKQPGRFARISYNTGRQWQRMGSRLYDLNDPQTAWDMAVGYQHKHPDRDMYVDVLMREQADWKVPALLTIRVKDYLQPNGLAALPAPAPAALPVPATTAPPMEPQAPQPLTWQHRQAGPMSEPPPGMGEMGSFMFRQQGHMLDQERLKVQEMQRQLQASDSEKAALKAELDDAKMELRHKEREYKADLRDAEARIRSEVENELEPPKGGMNGLVEAISNPSHPLAGILGIVAGKFLGDGAGAAPAGPRNGNQDLQDALDGIAELLPDEEVATKVYAALNVILKHPQGLQSLLIMAGLEPPQPAN